MRRHLELKINYHDGDGKTALIWAADRSRAEVMKVLLESPHIDVNIKGNGYTALIIAARSGEETRDERQDERRETRDER